MRPFVMCATSWTRCGVIAARAGASTVGTRGEVARAQHALRATARLAAPFDLRSSSRPLLDRALAAGRQTAWINHSLAALKRATAGNRSSRWSPRLCSRQTPRFRPRRSHRLIRGILRRMCSCLSRPLRRRRRRERRHREDLIRVSVQVGCECIERVECCARAIARVHGGGKVSVASVALLFA